MKVFHQWKFAMRQWNPWRLRRALEQWKSAAADVVAAIPPVGPPGQVVPVSPDELRLAAIRHANLMRGAKAELANASKRIPRSHPDIDMWRERYEREHAALNELHRRFAKVEKAALNVKRVAVGYVSPESHKDVQEYARRMESHSVYWKRQYVGQKAANTKRRIKIERLEAKLKEASA